MNFPSSVYSRYSREASYINIEKPNTIIADSEALEFILKKLRNYIL